MNPFSTLLKFFLVVIIGTMPYVMSAQTIVKGTILDKSAEPLIGANIVIEGTTQGTVTDFNGEFSFQTSQSPPFNIEVSYTGFESQIINVTTSDEMINIVLKEGGILLDQVVVSASRRREKIQEAPASISVITARNIEASAANSISPIRNLINQTGVQIQQQSAVRMNIEMRGQSVIFSTKIFPIKDYRSLLAPGLGQFDAHASGVTSIDLDRIEVVRGPGSALYGPGVTSGVVHFITKSAIDHTGTTVELLAGNLSTYGATIRHAKSNEAKTFGYKVNVSYKKGNDFTLDGSEGTVGPNGVFVRQLDKLRDAIYQPNVVNNIIDATSPGTLIYDRARLDKDGDGNLLEPDWFIFSSDLTLEFRPSDDLSFTVLGGFNQNKSLFFNQQGEGLQQNAEYWTQARMQFKGLFAQMYYLNNDGGTRDRPTFLYQTGNRTPVGRSQFETQIQYNFDTPSILDASWTAGFDYRLATQNTENLVYGRNEDDDDYSIVGVYLQGKIKLHNTLDLIIAGRYDQFNFINENSFSPRAALVYKPSPSHTFRASYNRSNNAPSNLNVNIDFPLATPVPGLFDVWLVGNKEPHLFGDNPMIDVTIPGVPDLPYGTPGLPLAIPYGAVTPALLSAFESMIGTTITQDQFNLISGLLNNYSPQGFTGTFQSYNLLNGLPLTPIDAGPAKLNIFDTYELGYKGVFNNRLGLTIDLYQNKSKDFWFFNALSPVIALVNQNIAEDLGNAVQSDLQPQIEQALLGLGLDAASAAAAAAQFGSILNGAYNEAGASFTSATEPLYGIFGAVESNLVPQGDNITHVAAGYRTFGKISYIGMDLGVNYFVNNDLSVFANYSYLSKTEFEGTDLGIEDGSPIRYFLNTPKGKYRFGASYTPESGLRGALSFQHDGSFNADLGQYNGVVDARNLVDFSIGYQLENGINLDLGFTNLFDSKYRALPNMPQIGRTIIAKATYHFGE